MPPWSPEMMVRISLVERLIDRARGMVIGDARGLLGFSSSTLIAQVINMACTLLVLRWLAPEQLGVWQTMLVIESYLMFLRVGIINGMNRQLPLLVGQGRDEEARRHVATALTYTMAVGGLVLVGLEVVAFITKDHEGPWSMGFATLGVYASSRLYSSFIEATFRGGQDFVRLARALLIHAGASLGTLPLVVQWGFTGLCARAMLLAVFFAGLVHWWRPMRAQAHFDRPTFRSLLKIGLPLFGQNYFGRIALTAGPLVLLWLGGAKALGLYAPVTAMLTVAALLPNSIMSYTMPRQTFEYGQHGSARLTVERARRLAFGLMAIVAPLALLLIPFVPWLVESVIPQYQPASTAMQIGLLIGVVRIFSVATSVYSTLAAWKPMFVNQGVLGGGQIIGAVVGGWLMPSQPWLGVTCGLFVAYLLYIPVTLLSLASVARQPDRIAV